MEGLREVHLLRLQDGGVLSEELAYPKIMSTHYFSEVDSAYPTQLGGKFQTVVVTWVSDVDRITLFCAS